MTPVGDFDRGRRFLEEPCLLEGSGTGRSEGPIGDFDLGRTVSVLDEPGLRDVDGDF